MGRRTRTLGLFFLSFLMRGRGELLQYVYARCSDNSAVAGPMMRRLPPPPPPGRYLYGVLHYFGQVNCMSAGTCRIH